MFAFFQNLSRPVMLGAAGAAAGYFMGKSKKQKQQLALGYSAVGAVGGFALDKMTKEKVEIAVEASEVAEEAAAGYFGELEIMDGFGAAAPGTPAAHAATAATAAAPIAAAASTTPSRRNFRVIPGRRRLPYRRLRQRIPPYRPAFRKPIKPRRIFRARGRVPYRRLYYPQARFRNAMRPYAPRITYNYNYGPRQAPGMNIATRGRNYYGPATTQACMMLLAKIRRMASRIEAGETVYKRPGVPLTAEEAPAYLLKLRRAYRKYCAQLGW